MFLTLWNYLRGYVIIRVSGFSVERFVNLAALRGVYIWDLRHDGTAVIMSVSLEGFKNLRECSKKTRCRYKILEKRGLPFIMDKSRRRKVYSAGAIIFIGLLYIMSSFIWTVEVKGNDRISKDSILMFCAEEGLCPGRLKSKANIEEITKKILINFEEVSWVAITTEGTKATVTVVERIPETAIEDRESPSNITAAKNCVIESISVSSGTAMVKAGDVVEKGDILVTGKLVMKDGELEVGEKFVRSSAEIYGRSIFEFEREIPLTFTKKTYTSNKKKNSCIVAGDYIIDGIKTKIDLEKFEATDKKTKEFKIGDYVVPLKIETVEYTEFYEEELERTEDEAKNMIFEEINKVKEEIIFNGGIIQKDDVDFISSEGKLKAVIKLTVSELIGVESPLENLGSEDISNGTNGENSGN
ncbi:MAG: sporulation protein YqfD [Firmicutes bacterium]|nr:sporulation protein YqfD [Bacillota bacterium]